MKKSILFCLVILITSGCAYTVFAPPTVLYSSDNSIAVKYRSAGVQSHDEAGKAMKIISDHCKGKYNVTNRTESDGWTTIDARCE
jgi:hypothetical protein